MPGERAKRGEWEADARRVQAARKKAQLTQRELLAKIGEHDLKLISLVENARKALDAPLARKIAKACGVPVADLVGSTEPASRLERIEEKVDLILERLPTPPADAPTTGAVAELVELSQQLAEADAERKRLKHELSEMKGAGGRRKSA